MKRIIAVIALCLFIAAPAAAQFYLGVIKGEAKKIPIAVIDVYDDANAPAARNTMLEVLQADLRRSQIFLVIDPKKLDVEYSGKDDPKAELLKRGGTFGLTGAVWARLSRKGNDLQLTGKLYDAVTGMRIATKEYFGNEESARRMRVGDRRVDVQRLRRFIARLPVGRFQGTFGGGV